jgi:hypothetical protein
MSDMKKAVFAIYTNRNGLEKATEAAVEAGFSHSDISVLAPEGTGGPSGTATEKATKAPEGATAGGASGATVGGVVGLLAGLGALAIPGVGPFLAAGPIMGALAGFGVGGAVGAIAGALIGMGIPEYEAKRYEGRIKKGGILLSLHCSTPKQVDKAKEILELAGGEDISVATEAA